MGQWGDSKDIGGVRFIPFINTGTAPFEQPKPWDIIERIVAVDKDAHIKDAEVDRLEEKLNKQYLHKTYWDWKRNK